MSELGQAFVVMLVVIVVFSLLWKFGTFLMGLS